MKVHIYFFKYKLYTSMSETKYSSSAWGYFFCYFWKKRDKLNKNLFYYFFWAKFQIKQVNKLIESYD